MLRARYRRIVLFFSRLLVSHFLWDLILPRLGLRRLAERTRPQRLRRSASAFRSIAVRMGGVLIKVGQFLSTRVDVLPPEFTEELQGLQDEVPAEKFSDIRLVAEAEFGGPLTEKFAFLDETPLAAASLGQVHRARLRLSPHVGRGTKAAAVHQTELLDVVVKIQRPNIENIIATDLTAIRTVGKWLYRYKPIRRRANVPMLLDEFTRVLYEEIDYIAEGRNAEIFASNFRDFPNVRVPRVIWSHTTKRVLTLENVWAIKITDYQAITQAGISRAEVASRLLRTYLKQIFEDNFFHADPHPGNLFVNPLPLESEVGARRSRPWELTFVDFGMVGRVPSSVLAGLQELLIGVGMRDAGRVIKAYQMMDILLPNADLELLEKASAKVFEEFWGKNMTELTSVGFEEIRGFTEEFRELLYQMPFQMPQNLIFLGRCVSILSGMCTGLDPNFNVWEHLAPYAEKLLAKEAKPISETVLRELELLVRSLISVPKKMDSVLSKLERGEIAVRTPEFAHQMQKLERSLRQVTQGIIFAALLMGGIQLYLAGQAIFGGLLLGGATLTLIWMFIRSRMGNNH